MKYKPEWRGKLRVDKFGNVRWRTFGRSVQLGRVKTVSRAGAKSPGGMATNTVFVLDLPAAHAGREFASMTGAIEFLLSDNNTLKTALKA